jgi:hypothetical protein
VRLGSISREFSRARISTMSSTSISSDTFRSSGVSVLSLRVRAFHAGRSHSSGERLEGSDFPVRADVGSSRPCREDRRTRSDAETQRSTVVLEPFELPRRERTRLPGIFLEPWAHHGYPAAAHSLNTSRRLPHNHFLWQAVTRLSSGCNSVAPSGPMEPHHPGCSW